MGVMAGQVETPDSGTPPAPGRPRDPPRETYSWRGHLVRLVVFVGILVGGLGLLSAAIGYRRVHTDFWPPDGGVVITNIVAGFTQIFVAFLFAVLFYKPLRSSIRARIHRFLYEQHTQPVQDHNQGLFDSLQDKLMEYHPLALRKVLEDIADLSKAAADPATYDPLKARLDWLIHYINEVPEFLEDAYEDFQRGVDEMVHDLDPIEVENPDLP